MTVADNALKAKLVLPSYVDAWPWTFTRASTAYLDGVSFNNDVPRTNGGGLLIEESTTNLFSADIAGWNNTRCTRTATAEVADPFPGAVPYKQTSTTSAQEIYTYAPVATITAGGSVALSAFVHRGDTNYCHLTVWDGTANGARQWFNIAAGTVGSVTTFGAGYTFSCATITPVGTEGWYRISATCTTVAATAYARLSASTLDGNIAVAAAGNYAYFSSPQLEQKPYATSWTPPATVRAAEVLNIPASVLNATEGTIELDWSPAPTLPLASNALDSASPGYILDYMLSDTTKGFALRRSSAGNYLTLLSRRLSGNLTQEVLVENATKLRIGIKWDSVSICLFVDGTLRCVLAKFDDPGALTLGIGYSRAAPTMYCSNASFSSFRISNTARSDAELAYAGPLGVDKNVTFYARLGA